MKEIWKDIPGYEGIYKVSSLGRVKSLKRKGVLNDRMLKNAKNTYNYFVVTLHLDGSPKQYRVHQLVAMAFLGHVPNGYELIVDHINNISTDNRVENLQITTVRENTSKDRTNTSSEYTGVSYNKLMKKYKGTIRINGINHHLGCFNNEYDAHLAYQSKLKEINQ